MASGININNGSIVHLPSCLSELYRGTPNFSFHCIEDQATIDITNFLQSALDIITPVAGNSHSGTILLPLCVQSDTFNSNSPKWAEGMNLLTALQPALESCELFFNAINPTVHAASLARNRSLQNGPQNAGRGMGLRDNCFHSMRLTINVQTHPVHPQCGHPSPFCVVVALGPFTGGEWTVHRETLTRSFETYSGDLLIIDDRTRLGVASLAGVRYQLELFLPIAEDTMPKNMPAENKEMGGGSGKGGGGRGTDGKERESGKKEVEKRMPAWAVDVLAYTNNQKSK